VVEHLPSKIGVPNSSIVKKQTKNPRSDIWLRNLSLSNLQRWGFRIWFCEHPRKDTAYKQIHRIMLPETDLKTRIHAWICLLIKLLPTLGWAWPTFWMQWTKWD
jgi:hypothetical protein